MYDFHYKYIMKDYPNAKLLSVIQNKWYDFSNYIEIHTNWDDSKQLIPGYFKDEFAGRLLLEFIGLRAKMYSILPLEGGKKATAKGINGIVKDEIITHSNYKQSLFNKQ